MKKYAIGFLIIVVSAAGSFAQIAQIEKISPSLDVKTFVYSVKDSNQLGLDVYTLKGADSTIKKPCVLFVFGGAFVGGHRNDSIYNKYFNSLAGHNFVVVSISYRLGLKGVKHVSKFNVKPLKYAVEMAVEDVYDATRWINAHANELGIDTSKVILSGSSAGAITVLQADYWQRNENTIARELPVNFQYAGVISFSGAILNFGWSLNYHHPPAPTMLFHGSGDKIVPYKKIKFFNIGFYGSSHIAKIARKKNYSYYFYDYVGLGHEVSILPIYYNMPDILSFIDTFIIQKKPYQIEYRFKDPQAKPRVTLNAKQLFEKLQQQH